MTEPQLPDHSYRDVQLLARIMDTAFSIPGTRFRFGIDSLIGLIPGAGDLAGLAVSIYILVRARQIGVPWPLLSRMFANVLIDAGVGSIPVLGDIFDFAFKANARNVDLLKDYLRTRDNDPHRMDDARDVAE